MDAAPAPSGDGAILSQILLKQGEMSTQLSVISVRLEAVPDHETRIRSLEKWKYGLPISALLAAASIVVSVAGFMHH